MGPLGERVTNLDLLGLLSEFFKEFVVDSGLDKDATTSTATLAVVPATQLFKSVLIYEQ
jgi:hypothetical protein